MEKMRQTHNEGSIDLTREALEQGDVEGPGQHLADLVDGGAGCVGEAHGQVVTRAAAQQEAHGRTDRCAHRHAARRQIRETKQLQQK